MFSVEAVCVYQESPVPLLSDKPGPGSRIPHTHAGMHRDVCVVSGRKPSYCSKVTWIKWWKDKETKRRDKPSEM